MIGDPVTPVECDTCGMDEQFDMTSLVQRSWDNRNLHDKMRRAGWTMIGEHCYCPECTHEMAEELNSKSDT